MKDAQFITKQLTTYRKWPNKKKGVLFYIHVPSQAHFLDAIVLIDSPIRIDDEPGSHDLLHQAEEVMISADTIIVSGYFAYQVNRLIGKNVKYRIDMLDFFDDINEWNAYYERRKQAGCQDYIIFMRELHAIVECKQQFLNELLKPYFEDLCLNLNALFYAAYNFQLSNWLNTDQAIFLKNNIKITFSDNDEANSIIRADYILKELRWAVSGKHCLCRIEGIQAFIMNYMVVKSVRDDFTNFASTDNFIADVKKMMDYLWNEPINIDELDTFSPSLMLRQIYDVYINVMQPKIYDVLAIESIPFTIMDEDKKKAVILKEILRREREMNNYEALMHLPARNRDFLNIALQYFFDYILQLLKDFPDECNECKQLINNDTSTNAQTSRNNDSATTTATTTHEPRPLLRNSFINNLDKVYDILVLENLVLPNQFELFEKAMTLQLQPEQRIIWKGLKYKLASFIAYAYEGSQSNTWLAANAWSWKGKPVTPELKDHLFKSHTDESAKKWKELFQNLQ